MTVSIFMSKVRYLLLISQWENDINKLKLNLSEKMLNVLLFLSDTDFNKLTNVNIIDNNLFITAFVCEWFL